MSKEERKAKRKERRAKRKAKRKDLNIFIDGAKTDVKIIRENGRFILDVDSEKVDFTFSKDDETQSFILDTEHVDIQAEKTAKSWDVDVQTQKPFILKLLKFLRVVK